MKIEKQHIKLIREHVIHLDSKNDLVDLLNEANNLLFANSSSENNLSTLNYYANPNICPDRYRTFTINKKSGGQRIINTPCRKLKSILFSLNFILQCVYNPSQAVNGFVIGKSVVDNAKRHINNRYVYNIDLKDFFHSFDRNRVKMSFMNAPFNLNGKKEPIAFFLACLCTHPIEINQEIKVVLPQGSPTSPTITNIACIALDRRLSGLAKRFGAVYSRYADDITFSAQCNIFINKEFQIELQRIIIDDQKFEFNTKKTRLQKTGHRQEVTGLLVNEKVNVQRKYVKQIRMWIHYWEKYGYNKASSLFFSDYQKDKGCIEKKGTKLKNVLKGKLLYLKMVKGENDTTYKKLEKRFDQLLAQESTLNKVLQLWKQEGIEQAMSYYYDTKRTK